jgi:hypothetical protein
VRRPFTAALLCAPLLFPLLVACGSAGSRAPGDSGPVTAPSPQEERPARPQDDGPRGAEAAVRRTYEALAGGRRAVYFATLDPDVRAERLAGAALTFATQGLLRGGAPDRPRYELRDVRYAATVDPADPDDEDGGAGWARVRVTGVVANPALGVEQTVDAVEVVRRVDGVWFTSLPLAYTQSEAGQVFAQSAEGERLAAAREAAASRGRRLLSIESVEAARPEGRQTAWAVTLRNPDASPHTLTLQLRGLNGADGRELLDAQAGLTPAVERALVHRFHLAPLSRATVRPAVDSALLASLLRRHPANALEGIEPVIYTVDGAPPESPEEVAARIGLTTEGVGDAPRIAEYGGVPYLDSFSCRITLHNAGRIGYRLEDVELAYTTVQRRADGGLVVRHRTQALEDILIPAGGAAFPVTAAGHPGSRLAPAADLLQAGAAWLAFTIVDRGERIEQRRYVPGCEVSLATP